MTLEVVRFRKATGADAERLEQAAASISSWLAQQPGYRGRMLARPEQDDGVWVDIVSWDSAEDADAAMAASHHCPGMSALMRLLDGPSVDVAHLQVVHEGR
jgi:heme-degrading monooxygenase HmoA